MERAAAGTPLRRERGLVAPREGVITAPGLIPAEVPGVTFPSFRAVVSVASGRGGGEGGEAGREGGRGRCRAEPRPCAHPGGRREPCEAFSGAGRWPGSPQPPTHPGISPSPLQPSSPQRTLHSSLPHGLGDPGSSTPPLAPVLPHSDPSPHPPGFPTLGSPSRARGGGCSSGAR